MPDNLQYCPDCRSKQIRRRTRSGFALYVASMFNRWPYRCEECGSDFLLRKRYLRIREGKSESVKAPEPTPSDPARTPDSKSS